MVTINIALIFWLCCVGYPVFTLLQSLALIWLIWRFRSEIFQKMPDESVWEPQACCLLRWSQHGTVEELDVYVQVDESPSLASGVHA